MVGQQLPLFGPTTAELISLNLKADINTSTAAGLIQHCTMPQPDVINVNQLMPVNDNWQAAVGSQ